MGEFFASGGSPRAPSSSNGAYDADETAVHRLPSGQTARAPQRGAAPISEAAELYVLVGDSSRGAATAARLPGEASRRVEANARAASTATERKRLL